MAELSLDVADVHISYRVTTDGKHPNSLRETLVRRFQPRPTRLIDAVRGVTFTAQQGEAIAVIGRNGCGKSTLLRGICGLLPLQSGQILAAGEPALLSVSSALNSRLTGRDNIELGAVALGMSIDQAHDAADDIITFADIGEFIDLPITTYSSGMKARLQFAIATTARPDILLVDEALAVGDESFLNRSRERMRNMLDASSTVLLVSHSLSQIAELCDRTLWMDDGKLVADGPTDEILGAYKKASS